MALTHNMFEQLVDDELVNIVEEQDWSGVRKYIASYYKTLPPEEQRRLYEERFKPDYIQLVDKLLSYNLRISVWDGEDWGVRKSQDRIEILEMIEAVEEAQITAFDFTGHKVGWALIVPHGVGPDETIADCTLGMEDYCPEDQQ